MLVYTPGINNHKTGKANTMTVSVILNTLWRCFKSYKYRELMYV